MFRIRWTPTVLVTLLSPLLFVPAQGQDLTMVWEFTPKAEALASFEAALKAHSEFRQENGDPWSWGIGQVVVGGNVGTYYALSGPHEWADFDAYGNSDFAKLADAHWAATVAPLVEKTTNWISRALPELSRLPEEEGEYLLFDVTAFHLKPDGEMAANEAVGKVRQAMIDADAPIYWSAASPTIGAEGPTLSIMGMAENWAGFADPDPGMEEVLVEAYGEEGAMEIFNQFASSYHYYESFVVLARPDLSVPGM